MPPGNAPVPPPEARCLHGQRTLRSPERKAARRFDTAPVCGYNPSWIPSALPFRARQQEPLQCGKAWRALPEDAEGQELEEGADTSMDERLLRKAQDGDPEAFEALMADLESLVWRVCWHYTGNREDASDCGQEAMIRIWRSLGSFRFDCAFETWVYRIAANCSLDFLRKSRRHPVSSLEPLTEQGFDPPDSGPGPEEQALRNDEQERLRQAIADLPEDQRDALVLTQLEGRSYEEAARMLSIQEGTLKSRINRARSRLKVLFSPEKEPSSGKNVQRDRGDSSSGADRSREKERRDRP